MVIFGNYLPLERSAVLHLNKLHPRMLCAKYGTVEIGQLALEKKIFQLVSVFSLFFNYLPLEKGRGLHMNKLESPSTKDTLCQVWLKWAYWFWRR